MELFDYQKDLINALSNRELRVISAGRQVGKSMINTLYRQMQTEMTEPAYRVKDSTMVDGERWYTVRCTSEIGKWIRTQNTDLWYEHIDQQWVVYKTTFDINEKLHTLISIKWGDK